MAVIVSDSNNTSYTGRISTANGFYRAEAYNLGTAGSTTLALSSDRTIAVTFANAGACQGLALCIRFVGDWYVDRNITVKLQENVVGTWTDRVSVTKTPAQIIGSYGQRYFSTDWRVIDSWVAFKFATPYTVDTTASKWRFYISQSSTPYSNWTLRTSDNTNPSYVTWCNNKVTYSDTNDAVVCVDKTYIDANFNPKPYTATGDTTFGTTVVLVSSPTEDDPHKLIVDPTYFASPVTWTIDGVIQHGTGCGIQIGSRTNRIPYSKQFKIVHKHTTSLGHVASTTPYATGCITHGYKNNTFDVYYPSLEIAGEIPTLPGTTLSSNAASGQPTITVTDSPASWSVGDRIIVAKSVNKGRDNTYRHYVISSISGNNITFTTNLSAERYAGGIVINLDAKYGVRIESDSPSKGRLQDYWYRGDKNYIYDLSGFIQLGTGILSFYNSPQGTKINSDTYSKEFKVEDCTFAQDPSTTSDNYQIYGLYGILANKKGISYKRIWSSNSDIITGNINYPGYLYPTGQQEYPTQGEIIIENLYQSSVWVRQFLTFPGPKISIKNSKFQGIEYSAIVAVGNDFVFENNEIWGNNILASNAGGGAVAISPSSLNNIKSWKNNTYNNNASGIILTGTAVNAIVEGDSFGQVRANTTDVGIHSGIGINQIVFKDTVGDLVLYLNNRNFASTVGYIRFNNWNTVNMDNRELQAFGNIYSTGTGLSDTTAHNSGYAMRFENTSYGDIQYIQKIPTGNIQNKDMSIGVWVKLNSANYWSGTYTMPKLTLTYDGSTTVSATASQTTNWQYLSIPFTPTTTTGVIDVKFVTKTDKTGSNSYVYFDDFSALYPAGYSLNLGNMDLWYLGSPVTPMIATNVSASDVWAVPTSQLTGSGTTGKKLTDLKNSSMIVGGKIII